MGRAKAWPAPSTLYIAGVLGATSPARASREQACLRSRLVPGQPQTSDQAIARWEILHRQTSGTALQPVTKRPTSPAMHLALTRSAHALRLAQSSRWPAGQRVHPGVTTALSLTLVAASLVGWQGQARGMRASMSGCH